MSSDTRTGYRTDGYFIDRSEHSDVNAAIAAGESDWARNPRELRPELHGPTISNYRVTSKPPPTRPELTGPRVEVMFPDSYVAGNIAAGTVGTTSPDYILDIGAGQTRNLDKSNAAYPMRNRNLSPEQFGG